MSRGLAIVVAIACGVVAAFLTALAFVGTVYGFLWIYVYGDNPWPAWVEPVMSVLLFIVALGVGTAVGFLVLARHRSPTSES